MLQSISQELVKNGVINQDDIEVCVFGLKQGAVFLLNIISMIIIGIFLGMLPESIIFILAFVPIRSFAGGYHAKTQTRCYVLGCLSTYIVLLLAKHLVLGVATFFVLGFLSSIVISFFAPVQDSNKPLEEIEMAVYKKISLSILALENLIMVLFRIMGFQRISNCIMLSLLLLCIAVAAGKLLSLIARKQSE